MPAVLAPQELMDVEEIKTQHLPSAPCQVQAARPGLWRRLTHRMSALLSPVPQASYAPAYDQGHHRFESPMDRCMREYPTIAPYALAIF